MCTLATIDTVSQARGSMLGAPPDVADQIVVGCQYGSTRVRDAKLRGVRFAPAAALRAMHSARRAAAGTTLFITGSP